MGRLACAWACACLLAGATRPVAGQLAPPATGGIVELDRLLQRLSERRRILVIGAHPDDEDTELLTLAAQGYGARAAYLALSRGEGGQNLIGEELGEALGLLRSQELLAARATDGARQFFTRAYDFGFSKTAEETFRFWPADTLLKDAVRVVRRFRPHVIVSVFSGTPRDGHGQHQAAGITAHRVFDAAGDPDRFPELQRPEGLPPWRPLRLYQSTRFDTTGTTVRVQTGALDPRSGRSYHQIAMASRSLHRSQDMGQLQRLGPAQTRLGLIKDRTGTGNAGSVDDLFAGIERHPTWLTALADSLRGTASAGRMAGVARALAGAVTRLNGDPAVEDADTRVDLERALAIAAGLELDAIAPTDELVAGDQINVTLQVYNGGGFDVRLDSATVIRPARWGVDPVDDAPASLPPGTLARATVRVSVPTSLFLSQPYFLRRPRQGALYDWSQAIPPKRGEPFDPPPLAARAVVTVLGVPIGLTREVTYRFNDQAYGEIRQPLRIVPAVDVRLDPDVVVWPARDGGTRTFTVTLTSHARGPVAGDVRLVADGWPTPPAVPFSLEKAGDSRAVAMELTRPRNLTSAEVTVTAVARVGGQEFREHTAMVRYPHVRPTQYLRPASAVVRVEPLVLPRLARVGYVRGASDRVPEALQQVGLPVVLLTPQDLADGDLSRFNAIVVGSRAYETDTALVRHNDRLLAYARQGGVLLVQYQQYAFVQGRFAPSPLSINRPHDRVADEAAPVTVLAPGHPAFTTPNRIGDADWEGWPQERGLYFASTWDSTYAPLLEMHDPGEPPKRGGLLVASVGSGTYIYTGLAFFRALPAGVVGAYRLFLNLLAQ